MTRQEQSVYKFDVQGKLIEQKNRNGQSLTLSYDAAGLLQTITEPVSGRYLSVHHSVYGLIDQVSDPLNRTISFSYDSGNNLNGFTDALGKTTSYDIEVDGTVINNGLSTTYIHSGLLPNVVHKYRVRVNYIDVLGSLSWKAYALTQGSNYMLMSAMPTPRYGLGVATANGKIYAIGGYGGWNTVEEYDPVTDTWTAKAAMPTPRFLLAVVAVNVKIYAIGGFGSSGYLNTVEEYDPVTNTWIEKAAMSTSRYGLAAAVANGKVYAIGGDSSSGFTNKVEEYDPVTNTWIEKAAMPAIRYGLAAAATNGKVYAIGGVSYSGYTNKVEEYDPVTNTWLQMTNMPVESSYLGVGEFNNRFYAIGGVNSEEYLNVVQTQGNIISNPVLSAGSVTGQPGDVIQIPLTLNSLGDAGGISFELKFDPNLLTFQDATLTSISGFTSDYSYVTSYDPGAVTVIFYSTNAALIPDGVQSLGTLSFSVATGAQTGRICSLELQNVIMNP